MLDSDNRESGPSDAKTASPFRYTECVGHVGIGQFRADALCRFVRETKAVSSRSGPRFHEVCIEANSRTPSCRCTRGDLGGGLVRSSRADSAPLPLPAQPPLSTFRIRSFPSWISHMPSHSPRFHRGEFGFFSDSCSNCCASVCLRSESESFSILRSCPTRCR